jgi:20S proteasome subunit beta 1
MAVSFDGGVVLGADSRTSMGSYIANRVSKKITKITENIFVCRSGSAADTQAVSDIVTRHMKMHA